MSYAEEINEMKAKIAALEKPDRSRARPTPHVTVGKVYEDSKPFSITKALVKGIFQGDREGAKFEMDVLDRLKKAIGNRNPAFGGNGYWIPTSFEALGHEVNDSEDCKYVKSVFAASQYNYDPEEADWFAKRGIIRKTQSAFTDNVGGTLVAPPTMGPVIPLIRPQAALLAAGATQLTLPPSGRWVQPQITGAPNVQAVAESQDTPESDLTTDQLILTAKKIAGMARISEEAANYTSGTIDTLTRQELDRSLGLKMDAYGFYGPGGSSLPAGLTSSAYSSAVIAVHSLSPTPSGVKTDGNNLLPQYGDYLPALIEERSFGLDATEGTWVMRPSAYAAAAGVRADTVAPNDQAGALVDMFRRFGESMPNTWRGRKVVKTTNIKGDLTKGSGTNLSDVFFGIWKHCLVATYGAVQFAQGHDGNSFKRGQYLLRATMFGDIGFEYPSAFLWYNKVVGSQGKL